MHVDIKEIKTVEIMLANGITYNNEGCKDDFKVSFQTQLHRCIL